jgi:hypothetical protein
MGQAISRLTAVFRKQGLESELAVRGMSRVAWNYTCSSSGFVSKAQHPELEASVCVCVCVCVLCACMCGGGGGLVGECVCEEGLDANRDVENGEGKLVEVGKESGRASG